MEREKIELIYISSIKYQYYMNFSSLLPIQQQFNEKSLCSAATRMNCILVWKIVWNFCDFSEWFREQEFGEKGYARDTKIKTLDFDVQLKLFCGWTQIFWENCHCHRSPFGYKFSFALNINWNRLMMTAMRKK